MAWIEFAVSLYQTLFFPTPYSSLAPPTLLCAPENKRVWFALYSALVQSYRNPVQPIKTVYDQLTALLREYVIQDMSRSLIDIIKEVGSSLGYARLKEEQYTVIKDLIDGQDVFVALPTGFGKSACFACLPGVFDAIMSTDNSVVVVLSPLIAIMNDEVTQQIKTAFVSSVTLPAHSPFSHYHTGSLALPVLCYKL